MNRLAQIAMALAASVITLSAVMIAAKPMDTDDMAENKRVVNGEDALEGRYPWVVALEAMASEVFVSFPENTLGFNYLMFLWGRFG